MLAARERQGLAELAAEIEARNAAVVRGESAEEAALKVVVAPNASLRELASDCKHGRSCP